MQVFGAGCGVATRVVVNEHEGSGAVSDDGNEHIPWQYRATMKAALAHMPGGAQPGPGIHTKNPYFLVLQVA